MTNLMRVLCVLGLLTLVPAQAQEKAEKPQAEPNKSEQQPKPEKRSAPSRPAQSFTPSEKIRADTSVAFPADI